LRHWKSSTEQNMNTPVELVKSWFERQAFGVCEWWGDRLNIRSSNIRIFFIYTSFLTVGSPIIIYMIMAFWMRLKKMVGTRDRHRVWDL
jgi:phage shock protein PspC (stress-responsive transcriptional regulator)